MKYILPLLFCLLAAPSAVYAESDFYSVHIASYAEEKNALETISYFQKQGFDAFLTRDAVVDGVSWARCYLGKFATRYQAEMAAKEVIDRGLSKYAVARKIVAGEGGTAVLRGPAMSENDTNAESARLAELGVQHTISESEWGKIILIPLNGDAQQILKKITASGKPIYLPVREEIIATDKDSGVVREQNLSAIEVISMNEGETHGTRPANISAHPKPVTLTQTNKNLILLQGGASFLLGSGTEFPGQDTGWGAGIVYRRRTTDRLSLGLGVRYDTIKGKKSIPYASGTASFSDVRVRRQTIDGQATYSIFKESMSEMYLLGAVGATHVGYTGDVSLSGATARYQADSYWTPMVGAGFGFLREFDSGILFGAEARYDFYTTKKNQGPDGTVRTDLMIGYAF